MAWRWRGVEARGGRAGGIGDWKVGWGRGVTLTKPPRPFGEASTLALQPLFVPFANFARPTRVHPVGGILRAPPAVQSPLPPLHQQNMAAEGSCAKK